MIAPFFLGHGNSVYATGGRGTKLAQTKYVMRLLGKILASDNEWVAETLLENGLMEKYLAELTKLTDEFDKIRVHEFEPKTTSLPPESFISLDICCEILYTIASVMENNTDRKEALGKYVVTGLFRYISRSHELKAQKLKVN